MEPTDAAGEETGPRQSRHAPTLAEEANEEVEEVATEQMGGAGHGADADRQGDLAGVVTAAGSSLLLARSMAEFMSKLPPYSDGSGAAARGRGDLREAGRHHCIKRRR